MAKSNRRKKQDRVKAEAKRAEQARHRARKEQDRAMMEHFARMTNPRTPSEEVAELVALELADSAVGGTIARARQHQAGLAAVDDGHRGIDVPWLRQELAMPSECEHSPLAKR